MNFEEIIKGIDDRLSSVDAAREDILQDTRKIVRMASETIKAVHREEWSVASGNIDQMRANLEKARQKIRQHEILVRRNYLESAEQEYAEAAILYALLHDGQTKGPEDLGIPDLSWLLGLADVVGELRRHALDAIRKGIIAEAEKCLELMDEIYSQLFSLDYPKGLTGGLREKTDAVRKMLQATRGDLAMASHTARLNANLEKVLRKQEDGKSG